MSHSIAVLCRANVLRAGWSHLPRVFWTLPLVLMVWGCSTISSDWRDAEKEKTAEAYQDFLKRYPGSSYAREARARLLNLRWTKLQSTTDLDGLTALQHDLDKEAQSYKYKSRTTSSTKSKAKPAGAAAIEYPPSLRSLFERISARRAELIWETLRGTSDTEQLNAFLKEFPKATARRDAELRLDDLTWVSAQRQATLAAWRDYLKRFGTGRHADEARRVAETPSWDEVRPSNDEMLVKEHLALFPQGATATPAREVLAELVWRRAESGKTDVRPYREYLELLPSGPRALGAQDAIDWASAEEDGTLAAVEQYLRRHPEGLFARHARNAIPTLKAGTPPKVEAAAQSALVRIRQQIQSGLRRASARGVVDITGEASVSDSGISVLWRGGGMVSLNQTVPGKGTKTKETYRLLCSFTGKVGPGGLISLDIRDKPRAQLRLDGTAYTHTAAGWHRQIERHFKPHVAEKDSTGTRAVAPK